MKIYFFTKHEITWGSSKERIGLYLPALTQKGHYCTVTFLIPNTLSEIWIGARPSSWFSRKIRSFWYSHVMKHIKALHLIWKAPQFDLIFIQKIILPHIFLFLLKKRNAQLFFDVDDLCFSSKVLPHFEHIIVGNTYLAEIAKQKISQERITVLPTVIDCSLFFPSPFKTNTLFTIGWAGSGENHFEHLKLLIKPFHILSKKYPLCIKMVGSTKKIQILFQSSGLTIHHIPWTDTQTLAQIVRSFDVGVMPLMPNAFSQGKCGFKALMYMASGAATVVSPVGVNQSIIQDGFNGFWAKNEQEWVEKLELLITQENLRDTLVSEGRKTVETFYSLEKNIPKFIDLVEC